VSILTDFEELAVYDCRIIPDKRDKTTTARLSFHTCDAYPDEWDHIAGIFSKKAVMGGSLDAFADAAKTKRGTATVDAVFLKEIESWREALARDLAVHNPGLTRRELNFAVQMTIDRIIFLRMTEDRGIEDYGRLQALLDGEHVYVRLRDLYRQADERYNSGLFHFNKETGRPEQHDRLTPGLTVSDTTLKDIIRNLYYPDSPYEFSVLPIEVLGQVYEQFLGKVIDLSPDRSVVIEEKPEVRKAGGVYYTPKYIVDYIVEQTVGKLLEGKKPGARGGASRLRIVDPACGSGSFLIGAYEYLLDWHRDEYVKDGPEKHRKVLYQGAGTQWMLTTDEKKRILLNNIYGADIDPQAVEVTKLSLLLKVLEGESSETLVRQLSMFHERALPDLSNNIKCGNSLIGSDFYDNQQMGLFDDEEHYRINVFDWKAAFPEVFAGERPGFDAVIGNPPYVNIRILSQIQGDEIMGYFKRKYSFAHKAYDIYVLFLEKSLSILAQRGLLGMIIPNKIATLDYAQECRQALLSETTIRQIADVSNMKVFGSVGVYPYIITIEKTVPTSSHRIGLVHPCSPDGLLTDRATENLAQSSLSATRGLTIHGSFDVESRVPTIPLGEISRLYSGTTGFSAEEMASHLVERSEETSGTAFDFIVSGNIDRYVIHLGNVRFMKRRFSRPVLPQNSSNLTANKLDLFRGSKIVIAGMTKRLEAAYDSGGLALGVQVYAAALATANYHYVLGILNSLLMSYLFRQRFQAKHLAGGFLAINKGQISQLPIRGIDFSDPSDQSRHDKIVSLVSHMLSLHERITELRTDHDRVILQHQINATDRQIDRIVYELYGLTDEEIAVVEGM
jgi:hypothetical protein